MGALSACSRQRDPAGLANAESNLGLAANTLDAYARAVEEYLAFSAGKDDSDRQRQQRSHRRVRARPDVTAEPRGLNVVVLDSGAGLANATLQQRITAVRLFYDYLMEKGLRA